MSNISVIVPVYKVEPYLRECIDSILNQTYTDFELILVDDGSPDNCGAICDEYAKKDNRIIVIHKENGGLSSARNAGIDYVFKKSNSNYISFIDGDDFVLDNYLEMLYNKITQGHDIAVVSYFSTDGKNEHNDCFNETIFCPSSEYFYFPVGKSSILFVAWGKLYKKELFDEIRFPLGKLQEDEYTTYKLIYKSKSIILIPEMLYIYRCRIDSITGTKDKFFDLYECEALSEQCLFFLDKDKPLCEIIFDRLLFALEDALDTFDASIDLLKNSLHNAKIVYKKIKKRRIGVWLLLYTPRISVLIKRYKKKRVKNEKEY